MLSRTITVEGTKISRDPRCHHPAATRRAACLDLWLSHRPARSGDPEPVRQQASHPRPAVRLHFFMAGFFPNLLIAEARAWFLGNPENWVPGVISIAVALCRVGGRQEPARAAADGHERRARSSRWSAATASRSRSTSSRRASTSMAGSGCRGSQCGRCSSRW